MMMMMMMMMMIMYIMGKYVVRVGGGGNGSGSLLMVCLGIDDVEPSDYASGLSVFIVLIVKDIIVGSFRNDIKLALPRAMVVTQDVVNEQRNCV